MYGDVGPNQICLNDLDLFKTLYKEDVLTWCQVSPSDLIVLQFGHVYSDKLMELFINFLHPLEDYID